MVSWFELIDLGLARAGLTLHMFGSFESDLNQHTSNHIVRTILKWPVIFIGASPSEAPSMYSLMTYGKLPPPHMPFFVLFFLAQQKGFIRVVHSL